MRRLIWLAGLAALVWSGWWFFGTLSLDASLNRWFEARRSEGWQAEVTTIRSGGFPLAFEKTLEEPLLADPGTGVAVQTEALMITAPAWWPGYVTLSLPGDAFAVASPLHKRDVAAKDARADLRLRPGRALEVEEMAVTSGPWGITGPEGSLMGAQALTLRMKQDADTDSLYAFTFDAPAFQPGSLPREALRIPQDWPVTFDSLALEVKVLFDRPFDRRTIETSRPQPRRVDLQRIEAIWGSMVLHGVAGLDVAEDGTLTGEVSLQARNWQEMLNIAETAGTLPAQIRPQVESILAALARGSGNPEALDLTLGLSDGTMFIGFIPIGPAPRLVLR